MRLRAQRRTAVREPSAADFGQNFSSRTLCVKRGDSPRSPAGGGTFCHERQKVSKKRPKGRGDTPLPFIPHPAPVWKLGNCQSLVQRKRENFSTLKKLKNFIFTKFIVAAIKMFVFCREQLVCCSDEI